MVTISLVCVLDGGLVASPRKSKTGSRRSPALKRRNNIRPEPGPLSARKSNTGFGRSPASTCKNENGSRRGPWKDEIIKSILDSYHVTDGCPPLATHWGGHDLAKTDWLRRFAREIADDENKKGLEAWNTLKEKCDTSRIIELLYLLTLRGEYRAEEDQDAHRAFMTEIERIIARYNKLRDDIYGLVQNPRLSSLMPYVGGDLLEEVHKLQESKEHLEVLRDSNKKWASRKRNPRDWYLLLLAGAVVEGTGRFHARALANLIESARIAHNERSQRTDEQVLYKRIQRWMKFMNAKVIDGRLLFRLGQTDISATSGEPERSEDPPIPF